MRIIQRFLALALSAALLLGCIPAGAVRVHAAEVASGTCGEALTWTLDENGKLTISGTGPMSGYSTLGGPWASCDTPVTEVVVEESVTTIGSYAFYQESALTRVSLPEGLTSIGSYAFYYCSALASINLPGTLKSIGHSAFYDCRALETVVIPSGVTVIPTDAFHRCTGLKKIVFPDTLTSIGNYSFELCSSLTEVVIPDSVTYVGQYAISHCDALNSITVGSSVATLDDRALAFNPALTTVYFRGDAPTFTYGYTFYDVTATVYYPQDNDTWTASMRDQHGGTLTWVPYTPCPDHRYDPVVTPPTCTEGGYTTYTCASCGDSYVDDYTDAAGHDYEATVEAPGCLTGGCTVYLCNACGFSYTDDYTEATGHNYKATVTEATCTEDGRTDYLCAGCGDSYSEAIPATGHSYANGICENCGDDKLAGYPVLQLDTPTDAVITDEVVANSNGMVYYRFTPAQTDRYSFTSSASVDTYGHLFDADLNQLAANDDGGSGNNFLLEYELTAGTNYVFGVRFYSRSNTGTIPVTLTAVHSYEAAVTTPPTCTSEGKAVYTCTYCGHSYVGSVAMTEHRYGDPVVTAPGCTQSGYSTYTCEDCGYSYRSNYTSATGHSYTPTVTEATCTEAGFTTYQCVCGDSYITEDTAALGHSYADGLCIRCGVEEPTAHGTCGANLYWQVDENNTLVIFGSGSMYDYEIFAAPWYDLADQITGIAIGASVTHIGSYAFCDLALVTALTIPVGVRSIGDSALTGCGGLRELTIPFVGAEKTVTGTAQPFGWIFGQDPYANCIDVGHIDGTYYYVPKDLTTVTVTGGNLYGYAFHNCRKLTTIHLRDGVANLEQNVFSGCSSLKSVEIASGLTSIGNYTFQDCTSLESVDISSSVTWIGYQAFEGCTSLKSITLPDSLTTIDSEAFMGCSSLESIEIPAGVTTIEYRTFENCSGLTSVVFPENLTTIEWEAFEYCTSLEELELPLGLSSMGNYAFRGCTGLTSVSIPRTLKIIPSYAFYDCTALTALDLPRGVTTISSHAFRGCTSLTDVSMVSVARIDEYAFSSCTSLTGITLPTFLGTLGNGAFQYCTALESITIPENIVALPAAVFHGCTALADVALSPDTVSIGNSAFNGCTALSEIELPETVTTIGNSAFRGCTALSEIELPETVTTIGDYAFDDCGALTAITLPDSVTTIGYGAFRTTGLTTIDLPEGITAIADYTFANTPLTALEIPAGVTSIGCGAFSDCSGLTALTFPENLQTIGIDAFVRSGLTSAVIPDSVQTIGESAFLECAALESVVIGSGLSELNSHTFYGCYALKSVTLSEGLTSIGDHAFTYCDALESIIIPGSVTSIEEYVFAYTPLQNLVFRGDAPAMNEYALSYVSVNAYYPVGNETWTADNMLNYGASRIRWLPWGDLQTPELTITTSEAEHNRSILSWDAVEGAVQYDIYAYYNKSLNTSPSSFSLSKIASVTETSYTDTAIEPGMIGWYMVAAVDSSGGMSFFSSMEKHLCRLVTPVLLSAQVSDNQVTLTWEPVEYADDYQIYRAAEPEGTYEYYTSTSNENYIRINQNPGTTYYYKISASRSGYSNAESPFSNVCSADVFLRTPQNLNIWRDWPDGNRCVMELDWDEISGAESYEVYRATGQNGEFTLIATPTNSYYTDTDVQPGKGYAYKIRAIAADPRYNSTFSPIQSTYVPLGEPDLSVSRNAEGFPVFTWPTLEGAVLYELYDIEDNLIASTTGTSFTYTDMDFDEARDFYLRVQGEDPRSVSQSYSVWAYRVPARPTVKITSDAASGKPKLSWDAVEGTQHYVVLRRNPGENDFHECSWPSDTGFIDHGTEAGKQYEYKVIAAGMHGWSMESKVVSRTCDLPRPVITLSNVASSGKIKISWEAVEGAAKYEVWRSKDNVSWSRITTTAKTSVTNTSTETGAQYWYKVKAIHENSAANSAYSSVKYRTCDLAQPSVTLTNVASSGKIKISWSAVDGAVKYEVWRSTDNYSWSRLTTTTKTSVTNTSTTSGMQYWYKVKAIHASSAANSAFSSVKSRTCDLAQPVITLTNVASSGKIKISWNAVSGAARYEVWRSKDNKTWSRITTTSATAITNTSTEAGVQYWYKVRAIHDNSSANSAYSSVKSRTCDLARPTVTLTNLSSGKIQVTWKAVTGAVKYEVWRSTDNETWTRLYTTTKTTYTNTPAASGVKYWYKVRAVCANTAGNSAYSTVKSITSK